MSQAERIIKKFGTQERLADALGTNQSVIAGWKRRGFVPVRQQAAVMDAAKRLEIDLQPADFFDLPEREAAA
jgi:hypothetical protein